MLKLRNNQKIKNNEGSILIGVLLMFLMIASISIALVNRSKHGAILATDSKKGYIAYQQADSGAEDLLNEIREIDNQGDLNIWTIPENIKASEICDGTGYTCFGQEPDGTAKDLTGSSKVADIFYIKKKETNQLLTRAVLVPMLDRVVNPVKNLKWERIDKNRCNIRLVWEDDEDIPAEAKVENLEVRKSGNPQLSQEGDWQWLTHTSFQIDCGTINGCNVYNWYIYNNEFDYGDKYSFSIKAKNRNPLTLDSLYSSPTNPFTVPNNEQCNGPQAVGCLPQQNITGGAESVNDYNCCGNGGSKLYCIDCFEGWNATGSCCTESCSYNPISCGCSECGTSTRVCNENLCGFKTEYCDDHCYSMSCSTDAEGNTSCSC